MMDTDRMRAMWAEVVLMFVEDTRAAIVAARRRKRSFKLNGEEFSIRSEDVIIKETRRYLRSTDFAEVAACVGLDVDEERMMAAILAGVDERAARGDAYRRRGIRIAAPVKHGTISAYNHKTNPCRCDLCREASTAYHRARREGVAA